MTARSAVSQERGRPSGHSSPASWSRLTGCFRSTTSIARARRPWFPGRARSPRNAPSFSIVSLPATEIRTAQVSPPGGGRSGVRRRMRLSLVLPWQRGTGHRGHRRARARSAQPQSRPRAGPRRRPARRERQRPSRRHPSAIGADSPARPHIDPLAARSRSRWQPGDPGQRLPGRPVAACLQHEVPHPALRRPLPPECHQDDPGDGRMKTIYHLVDIAAPRGTVAAALTSIEGLASWWTTQVSGDAGADGEITFTFGAEFNPVMHVVRADSDSVSWLCTGGVAQWADNTFWFDLADRDQGTRLRFRQEYAIELRDEHYPTYTYN